MGSVRARTELAWVVRAAQGKQADEQAETQGSLETQTDDDEMSGCNRYWRLFCGLDKWLRLR